MYIKSNMEDKEKIFLIDAYALIYRGYYAFIKNPRINSKGTDTSAIFGFMNSLLDLIKREKPNSLHIPRFVIPELDYILSVPEAKKDVWENWKDLIKREKDENLF